MSYRKKWTYKELDYFQDVPNYIGMPKELIRAYNYIQKLENALEYYSNDRIYLIKDKYHEMVGEILDDHGQIAREALGITDENE